MITQFLYIRIKNFILKQKINLELIIHKKLASKVIQKRWKITKYHKFIIPSCCCKLLPNFWDLIIFLHHFDANFLYIIHSNAGVFLWILSKFLRTPFLRTSAKDCFWAVLGTYQTSVKGFFFNTVPTERFICYSHSKLNKIFIPFSHHVTKELCVGDKPVLFTKHYNDVGSLVSFL